MPPRNPPKKVKLSDHFGIRICTVCEDIAVCFGWTKAGGVHCCEKCLMDTLAWIQLNEHERAVLLGIMHVFQNAASTQATIARLKAQITPELRQAIGQGEAVQRLMESAGRGEQ